MASITQLPSGYWRVQIRRGANYASKTFRIKATADRWAHEQEDRLERGEGLSKRDPVPTDTIGDLIELHLADMADVGRAARRSKEYTLTRLKNTLGSIKTANFTRERILEFGRARAKEGAGPVTLAVDISYLGTVLEHAAAVYGYKVPTEQLRLGRIALARLGLVGKSNERDRRPTLDELERIFAYFDATQRLLLPMPRLIKFAIATAMRQDEISRILWDDFNPDDPSVLVRQRKHPRDKRTNDMKVPLVSDTGYDAIALIQEQVSHTDNRGCIFPYNGRSVGTAFRRACHELKIIDLHFHDLRHEAISRLFEADWDIPAVATVSGHRDWKMLQRYANAAPLVHEQ